MVNYTEINDNLKIVNFNIEKINALIAEELKKELKQQIENYNLIINLEGVRFIDSSGFGVFLAVYKHSKTNNKKIAFANASTEIMELVKLMNLHTIFKFFDNVANAVNFM